MRKNLPIGVDNFRKLLDPENAYLFVDKTEMIASVINDGNEVTLITRPRRWGKSLNFSMLEHFFSPEVNGESTQGMFNNLKIVGLEGGRYIQEQGKYPVIFITFKEAKGASFELAMSKMKLLLCSLFKQHRYLLKSEKLESDEIQKISKYINEEIAEQSDLEHSLRFLSECLHKHSGKKAYILIDEYDAPVMGAYYEDKSLKNDHFVHLMTLFMKNFLGAGLKGNPYLKKGLMTGILRISHNEMLSGLNNLDVRGVLDDERYNQFYGFTEDEVKALFDEAGKIRDQLETAKAMYNGYEIKGVTLYNPWSVNKYLDRGELGSYWVSSGNDSLIKAHAIQGGEDVKRKFSDLIFGISIIEDIADYISFDAIEAGQSGVWMLMLYAGYLKAKSIENNGTFKRCELVIPNQEVKYLYRDIFLSWFKESYPNNYQAFLTVLAQGDIESFVMQLNQFMQSSVSVRDFVTENSYHTFVLGLICSLMRTHRIISNKVSAAGFLDVLLIPEQDKEFKHSPALLLEFKHIKLDEKRPRKQKRKVKDLTEEERVEELKAGAEEGFAQAGLRNYMAELIHYPHVEILIKAGLAFLGKASGAYYQKFDIGSRQEYEKGEVFPSVEDLLEATRESKKSRYNPGLLAPPRSPRDDASSSSVETPRFDSH